MSDQDAADLTVPARFRDALVAAQGDLAHRWFDDLPDLVGELLARWWCAATGPYANFALLLEEIGPQSLATVEDSDEAIVVIGRLARRLAVPAPPELPRMQPFFEQLVTDLPAMSAAAGHLLPARAVDAAVATCAEPGPGQPETVQHGDLGESNVLRGTREVWLAIDPQGYAGEIAFECLTHLRERWTELRATSYPDRVLRRRIDIFADAAEIDVERALRWTQARAVQTMLRSGGAPHDDGGVHEWMATTLTD